MTTRRDFLKTGTAAAAGIAFCSCGLLQSAHAQQPARQKLPVMVAGKRVKTIDVHAHCLFHEALDLLRAGRPPAETAPRPVLGAEEAFLEIKPGYDDSGAAPGKNTAWVDPAQLTPQTTTKEEVAARTHNKKLLWVIPIPGTNTKSTGTSSSH